MSGKQPKRKLRIGVDEYGRIPLHYAALNGDEAAVVEALTSGSLVDAQDDNGWTPLHFAAQSGHSGVLEMLLQRGANPNSQNSHGNNPLGIGVVHARQSHIVLRLLLAAGANPDLANNYGHTARAVASNFGLDLSQIRHEPA